MGAGVQPAVPDPRDLGIPVKGVCWTRLHPGRTADGRASLLSSMSQNNGGLFVVEIDLETGHCRQHAVQDKVNSTFSAASFRSLLSGILYIASGWTRICIASTPITPSAASRISANMTRTAPPRSASAKAPTAASGSAAIPARA